MDSAAIETKKTFCRVCHAACPLVVEVEHGRRIVAVRGDRDDPLFEGFTCIKGRKLAEQHHHPDRLRAPVRRAGDGFVTSDSATALDDIAARIKAIVDEHGPRAVASYTGTGAFQTSNSLPVATAWHAGFGSPSLYTSVTIDQPAHRAAALRMGAWAAGWHNFTDADVSLAVGYNPLVSSYGPAGGLQGTNPFIALRRAKDRGLRLVVIDPRRTELATFADVHLQVRPGEDPPLLAAMIRHILDEDLHDTEFCASHVADVDALRAAVDPFTPAAVTERCGVAANDIVTAAEMFAAGPRGAAGTGTGPNMAPHSMLTEHLTLTLNVLCGRVNRAGDTLESGGFLTSADAVPAQVIPPGDPAPGTPHRVGGLAGQPTEMLTNRLADEILEPGDGQVRALIVAGGNPVVAFPDQAKTERALAALDLLVVIDHRMTPTAELADWVIPARLDLERADVPHIMDRRFPQPYTNYTDAVVEPEGDVLSEWEVYAGISARNGWPVHLPGGPIPMADGHVAPHVDDDTVLDLAYATARMPMDEIRNARGVVHDDRRVRVVEGDPAAGRFAVAPVDVVAELADVAGAGPADADFPLRLISRRMKHVVNSLGREQPGLASRGTTNEAHLHPDDLAALGVEPGDLVEIESAHGRIVGVAAAAEDVRPGAVSMAHSWGGATTDDLDPREHGAPTNRLVSTDDGYDPITGMAVQSAIPVRLRRASSDLWSRKSRRNHAG